MKIISKIMAFPCSVNAFVTKIKKKFGKATTALAVGGITTAMTVMPSFAADPVEPTFSSADLEPILEGAKANIGVIMPIGIGLFTILFGISFLPMIIKKFKRT